MEKFAKWVQIAMLGIGLVGMIGAAIGAYVASSVRLAEYDLRITTLEHDREADQKALADYQSEMRAAVARALDLLTDVRLQIAKQTAGRHGG